jgi:1,4-alpha-glucan branching enzyme
VATANEFGAKFLREWTRTLKLLRPEVMLIAEDHSGWDEVTDTGPDGLGFDATWDVDFLHHLIGNPQQGTEYAALLLTAGEGGDGPLNMTAFAEELARTGQHKVVYHASHDEVGNSAGSRRTLLTAVNANGPVEASLIPFAEARMRFVVGMAMLSAGTPMFVMGEEVGAQKPFTFDNFISNREDIVQLARTRGQRLFKFFQDLIRFRLSHSALRSHNIEVLQSDNAARVLAFRRWDEREELLVAASLNNRPFASGYTVGRGGLRDGRWVEVFNSDSIVYGGDRVGNAPVTLTSGNKELRVVIPARGFVVLRRQAL